MSAAPAMLFEPRLARRKRFGTAFSAACLCLTIGAMATLVVLLGALLVQGWSMLSASFLTNMPSTLEPESGGMNSAIVGSIWLICLTAAIAVPVGVGAAVYLEEYAPNNRLTRFIKINISNLAGVPSIVYGILGLAVFARWLDMGRSLITGSLTMSLLVLPVIIIASREALAAVPRSIRHAAYALGASRWQTIRAHVLPAATPGIMTGMILSLSRAIGETAPLIMVGALLYIPFLPGDGVEVTGMLGLLSWFKAAITDQFAVMPIQIYNWAAQPDPVFHHLAAAGIVVLLAILLTMNALAILIRGLSQWKRP